MLFHKRTLLDPRTVMMLILLFVPKIICGKQFVVAYDSALKCSESIGVDSKRKGDLSAGDSITQLEPAYVNMRFVVNGDSSDLSDVFVKPKGSVLQINASRIGYSVAENINLIVTGRKFTTTINYSYTSIESGEYPLNVSRAKLTMNKPSLGNGMRLIGYIELSFSGYGWYVAGKRMNKGEVFGCFNVPNPWAHNAE